MRLITLLFLFTSCSADAEIYKCSTPSKQIIYQPTPCSTNTADKNIVNIPKLDERQQQEAQDRLKATETERQALDKAAQDAAAAKWQAEAPQREAAAARKEAAAARREAQQAPYQVLIPYPSYLYNYNHNYGQRPTYHPNNPSFSPNPSYNPSFSPYPSFAPHPAPYIPPYMPFPTTR